MLMISIINLILETNQEEQDGFYALLPTHPWGWCLCRNHPLEICDTSRLDSSMRFTDYSVSERIDINNRRGVVIIHVRSFPDNVTPVTWREVPPIT